MLELTVMVIGYNDHGDIVHTRSLPTLEEETGTLVRSISNVFHEKSNVKTLEVKLDISTQVVASSEKGLAQLEHLIKQKFKSLR